jgi:hypothetical protein
MSTGVTDIILHAFPRLAAVILHWQCIHIGAQANHARAAAAFEYTDHAGFTDAAMHLNAVLVQQLRHDVAGALLAITQLGMGVQIPSQRD